MDETLYKLIFSGEILPDFKKRQVRKNLKKLLNADRKELKLLFSGQPIVIRKGLAANKIRPYERALIKAGAVCRIVAIDSGEELQPTPYESVLESQHTEPRLPLKQRLMPRMGRIRFVASLWSVALLAVLAWWLPELLTPQLSLYVEPLEPLHLAIGLGSAAGLLLLYVSARRLHDIGSVGRKSLLLLLPLVNLLLLLQLIFSPGTKSSNLFGPIPAPAGTVGQLFGLWIPLLLVIAAGTYGWLHQEALLQLAAQLPTALAQMDIPLKRFW